MKINFTDYDLTDFYLKDGDFMGTPARLITPKITAKWTKANSIFRSSIWDMGGNLLSAGFKKFTNSHENPDNFPLPKSLDNTKILTKYDGSLGIFDSFYRQISARTRGTFSYKTLDNYTDFDYCFNKYPKILNWLEDMSYCSLLCEITSPRQKIVLSYGDEPDLTLIGVVDKSDYSLFTQDAVDDLARELGIKRPEYHNISNIDELVDYVKPRKDIEGICLYSNNDQDIHKIKADHYLKLHRMKSDLASFDKVVDLYFSLGSPAYQDFYDTVKTTFDFEIAEFCKENLQSCVSLAQELTKVIEKIREKVLTMQGIPRKDAALEIKRLYEGEGLTGFAFTLLNGKGIDKKDLIKFILRLKDENDEADADEYNFRKEVERDYYKPYLQERSNYDNYP